MEPRTGPVRLPFVVPEIPVAARPSRQARPLRPWRRRALAIGGAALAALVVDAGRAGCEAPQLPQAFVDTTHPTSTGRTISVGAGGDLQAALDEAQGGDVISLAAGATFVGPFTLPNKPGEGWIVVRTSTADDLLPRPGTRITPAQAALLPKIVGTGSPVIALQTAPGAHHFRFVGLEFMPGPGLFATALVRLGSGSETSTASLPHHLVFDRCYIHGDPIVGGRRGIALNSRATAVIDSHLSDWKEVGADSQAICGWNGPGPFKIANNYLEAAGENVMFGGADPTIADLVPSDIQIIGNHFAKPLAWKVGDPAYAGTHWTVKNLLELKNARRVQVSENLFERHWPDAQSGFAINLKSVSEDGTAPWSVTEDVTFSRNVVRDVAAGIKILGWGNSDAPTRRVRIENNYFDIDGPRWGGDGTFLLLLDGVADAVAAHNTVIQTGALVMVEGRACPGFGLLDNIGPHNVYGVKGAGSPAGNETLAAYLPGAVFSRNVIIGADPDAYPADNFYPPSIDDVHFVDPSGGDHRLGPTSPYKNAATDGSDPGADFALLAAALAAGGTPSSGGDTLAPQISIQQPAAGATLAGTVTLTVAAIDDTGVTRVDYLVDGDLAASFAPPIFAYAWSTASVADGQHHLSARAWDASGNSGSSAPVAVTVANVPPTAPTVQDVVWVDRVNATVVDRALVKTGGCDCADAGAVSQQQIAAGEGWIEFVAAETRLSRYAGLSSVKPGTSAADIDFAVSLRTGMAEVRERGRYRAETRFAAGDVFRVAVAAGVVTYYRNAAPFYARTAVPSYPLRLDTSLIDPLSAVNDARIALLASTPAPDAAPVVSVAAPAAGAVLSGSTTFTALASDDVAVTGVRFEVDGVALGPEIPSAPYRLDVDTAAFSDGPHTVAAVARDTAGQVSVSPSVPVSVSNGRVVQDVVWANLVNVAADGNSLQKTSGCVDCGDAGANSLQEIAAGDGWVEFTASETPLLRYAGLSTPNATTSPSEIQFALGLRGGMAEVREKGVYRAETIFATGDVFRVAVQAGLVSYFKNGLRFHTSTVPPSYPLRLDASLVDLHSTISRAVIATGP